MTDPGANSGARDEQESPTLNLESFREQTRAQLLNSIGGFSGVVVAALPTVLFVVVNALWGLHSAVIAAVVCALVLVAFRLARRQSVQQAISGLFGVLIAALIAARSGQARGYFLYGIWISFLYGGVLLASALARWPLAGVLWEFVDPTPAGSHEAAGVAAHWRKRRPLFRAYLIATAVLAAVFLVRGIVQQTLFRHDATGWLAVAKITLGFPPYLAALGLAVWLVRRARATLGVGSGELAEGLLDRIEGERE